jgi:hypothetical protein
LSRRAPRCELGYANRASFVWYFNVNLLQYEQVNRMEVLSPSRPDLAAHREATALPFPRLVQELTRSIGRKLTAYIAGVKDVRALDRWIEGAAPYKSAEERLRFAYRVVKTIEKYDRAAVVQAWLTGLNPELDDRVPIRLLREGDLEKVGPEILGAVRAFVAGG